MSLYAEEKRPDILVYSKLERNWNLFLLDEFQQIMDNFAVDVNPHSFVYEDESIVYEDGSIRQYFTESVSRLISRVQDAARLDILNLRPQLVIDDLGYSVEKIMPEATPIQNENGGDVTLKTKMSLKGVRVYAKDIQLNLVLNDLNGEKLQAFNVIVRRPTVILDPNVLLNFSFDLTFEETQRELKLKFERGDFSDVRTLLGKNSNSIKLSYDDIIIPKVNLKLMGRNITIDSEKIKKAVDLNREDIELILIEQLANLIEKNGAMDLLKKFENSTFNKTRWFNSESDTSTVMNLSINKFQAVRDTNILITELMGDFCTPIQFSLFREKCVENRNIKIPFSRITDKRLQESRKNLETTLKSNNDIKFIASVSEDYINNLVSHTIEMGHWNSLFEDMGITLGPNAISVRLDERGNKANVYIEAIKDIGPKLGRLLGQRYVQFPVVLEASVRVEEQEALLEGFDGQGAPLVSKQPHLVMKILDVDLSDYTLVYGVKELDLRSNIQDIRRIFRNQVLKKIRNALYIYQAPFDQRMKDAHEGTDLPGLMFPELYKLHLEKAVIDSDGLGRLNIMLKDNQ